MARRVGQGSHSAHKSINFFPVYHHQRAFCFFETLSMTIRVGKGGIAGEGVFATKSFESGKTLLAIERPDFTAIDSSRLTTWCSNCFTAKESIEKGVLHTCAGCHVLRYCSKVRCDL